MRRQLEDNIMSTWYERAVFYHVYPLGMTGAPKDNHEAQAASRFQELAAWIPHMAKLGCNAVYIGPLFEASTHGYDTRDYRLVDKRLGTNGDFKDYVKRCHEAGIRVVVDGVFNHTGREFFAFLDIARNREQSPYRDWYKGVNFGYGSPMGDSFSYEAWQGHFELPCLNLYNPQVKEYLFDTVQYWVEEFDIDGIRLDCANVLDFGFMKELRSTANQVKEDFWLMGEVIHGDYARWVNDEMLHSVTNYELHKGLYSGHNDHNYFEIAHTVRRLEQVGGRLYTFVDNHDENRIASKVNDREHLYPIYMLLFSLPGIPSVYYGSEWGIEGARTKTSDDMLRPAIHPEESPLRDCPLTGYISQLAHIHAGHSEFHGGRYQELLLTNRQYAFARFAQGSAVITAVNNDSQEVSLQVPVPMNASSAVDLFTGREFSVSDHRLSVTLAPNRGLMIKIKEDDIYGKDQGNEEQR